MMSVFCQKTLINFAPEGWKFILRGMSAPQRQNFHTDEIKSVWNPIIRVDWTME